MINLNTPLLLFDPGHGTREYTAGKRAPDNTLYEGEWAREIVDLLVKACKEELGIGCVNLVPEPDDIPRMTRVERAKEYIKEGYKCYYISIHINAASGDLKWHSASGFSVYVSKNASQSSITLAKNVYEAAESFGLQGNRSVPREKVWRANYDVLYYTPCPAILTENLYMDNMVDLEFLKSDRGKEVVVNYHLIGICKTLGLPYSSLII